MVSRVFRLANPRFDQTRTGTVILQDTPHKHSIKSGARDQQVFTGNRVRLVATII
jgi:hypothetical protein